MSSTTNNGQATVAAAATAEKAADNAATLPSGMRVSNATEVQRAYGRIRQQLPATAMRCAHPHFGGWDIWYKNEHRQWTGSFKERGALNTMLLLTAEQRKKGVIAASAGNHALALAYHGSRLGIPVTVVMPTIAPLTKIEGCKRMNANVLVKGATIADSMAIAKDILSREGQTYINGYNDPPIVNGAGSCGVEIMEQLPAVEAIVVPIGGAGLIAGVALAVKMRDPGVKIIGVESAACPSFTAARKAGKPVTVPVTSTIADGLHVPKVGAHSFEVANPLVDEVVVVEEKWIALACLKMVEVEKLVIEGAGVAGVAAVLSGQLDHLKGLKTAIVLCGGNIDVTTLGRVIERGLAIEQRYVRFKTMVADVAGGLAAFCNVLNALHASVKDIMQERPYIKSAKVTLVRITIETRGADHTKVVLSRLRELGFQLKMDTEEDFEWNVSPPQIKETDEAIQKWKAEASKL